MTVLEQLIQDLPVYSVSEISYSLKQTVEKNYGRIQVKGEVSGLKRPASGHIYFTLKDSDAAMDAVAWRGSLKGSTAPLEEGLEIIATGRLTTYPGRSKYQMIVEDFTPSGQGALLQLLEERKARLSQEGLFDALRKKPLPDYPQVIGIVTSPTGAVLQDILHRLEDRYPCHVIVWPVLVQGTEAAAQIAAAIQGFNRHSSPPDLIIVARGGGSLEDLWCFNEEIVVRAVADSHIPLISAVGHETDTTLIDYAADLRAPTPTAAAEMAVPVLLNLWRFVQDRHHRLTALTTQELTGRQTVLNGIIRSLPDLTRVIEGKVQRLEDWAERLPALMANYVQNLGHVLANTFQKVRQPQAVLSLSESQFDNLGRQWHQATKRYLESADQRRELLAVRLSNASYQGILEKGFCWTTTTQGRVVSRAAQVKTGTDLTLHYIDGKVCVIQSSLLSKNPYQKFFQKKHDDRQGKLL